MLNARGVLRGAATALILGVIAVAGPQAVWAAGPHDEQLTAEAARLVAEAARSEGAGALAALAALDEDVDPRALETAVRAGLGKGAYPLVAAHASWLLARLHEQRGETSEAAAVRASLGLL